MLDGLLQSVEGGDAALPFVRQFYGTPSQYLWEDDDGSVHIIHQGEGGEQGDPLMPMLFALGQHQALRSVQHFLRSDERLFAYLDDIYVVCAPERVGVIHARIEVDLWEFARIQVHLGKTQVWNRGGHYPPGCTQLQAAAQVVDLNARVWCGDGELEVQGLRVLGIPIGNPAFVRSELRKKSVLHSVLLDRIPVVQDLQSAWLLLLYCANTRANYWLRGVPPEDVAQFASDHDVATQSCLSQLLGAGLTQDAQDLASLPLSLGGCGLRSASRSKEAAHWASWADSLRMIHQRHPDVAALMVRALSSAEEGRHLQAAESCRLQLLSLGGFVPPEWHAAAEARPRFLANVDGNEPGVPARGWQFEASASVENFFFLHSIVPCSSPAQCALLRSQGGPFSGLPFTVFPTSIHQRFASVLFRVLLFRRLRLPLPLSSRTCRCGRPLDVLGHHRAACSTSGVLGRRGFALESAAARICREAGAVSPPTSSCGTWTWLLWVVLTVVALKWSQRGCPFSTGLSWPLTQLWSLPCALMESHIANVPLLMVLLCKPPERTYPELSGTQGRARLVVLAAEVGGRWSEETRCFISLLARAKVRSLPKIIRARAHQSWHFRWGSILSCAAARALASSLLENRGSPGTDGPTPSTSDVMCDWRHMPVEVG